MQSVSCEGIFKVKSELASGKSKEPLTTSGKNHVWATLGEITTGWRSSGKVGGYGGRIVIVYIF